MIIFIKIHKRDIKIHKIIKHTNRINNNLFITKYLITMIPKIRYKINAIHNQTNTIHKSKFNQLFKLSLLIIYLFKN